MSEKIYKQNIDLILNDLQKAGTSVDDATRQKLVDRLSDDDLLANENHLSLLSKISDLTEEITSYPTPVSLAFSRFINEDISIHFSEDN